MTFPAERIADRGLLAWLQAVHVLSETRVASRAGPGRAGLGWANARIGADAWIEADAWIGAARQWT